MKVIIAGSRDADVSMYHLARAVNTSGFPVNEIVSGHSGNVDILGEGYAKINDIPLTVFEADWAKEGRRAGPNRNRKMAEYADGLVAIWDGKSRGTSNMIKEATRRKLRVYVMNI